MTAFYNDNDPYCADWIRALIARGLIAPGVVDERDIRDICAYELASFTQVHLFAGLAGWPLALRAAGWPDGRRVWTGSPPCQPFSVTGSRRGFDDPRHLWPYQLSLIEKRRPHELFVEQVTAATEWVARVRSDLVALDYAVGIVPIEAASAGADHLRDRYWLVANGDDAKRWPADPAGDDDHRAEARRQEDAGYLAQCRASGLGIPGFAPGPDGKWRRLPPSRVRWLADGLPAGSAQLRALGNAIDLRPATAFIQAYLEAEAA